MNASFTDAPLEALKQVAAQHQAVTTEDLEKLKQQIDVALSIPESQMRLLSHSERIRYEAKYGPGAVCIGGFVIKRR